MPKLYLIPTPIADNDGQLPLWNRQVLEEVDYLVVENIRTARRFLATQQLARPIDSYTIEELSEHTDALAVASLMEPILGQGRSCGLMSEAGLPCVADPGSLLVAAAHNHGVEVVPLVGPSSIMLALMSSGVSGQSFAFNGYLPIKDPDRSIALKRAVEQAGRGQSQIFIETPYRNTAFLETLIKACPDHMRIIVAQALMSDKQTIVSRTGEQWKQQAKNVLDKEPAIFIIGQSVAEPSNKTTPRHTEQKSSRPYARNQRGNYRK